MPTTELEDWLDDFSVRETFWFAKRLSANDTQLTGGHQGGPLIPKSVLFEIFPKLNDTTVRVPTIEFDLYLDSHTKPYNAHAKWYWSKKEGRFTQFGGRSSAFLDVDNTGTIAVFVFDLREPTDRVQCHAWVCEGEGTEADIVEEVLGPIEPRRFVVWRPGTTLPQASLFGNTPGRKPCFLAPSQLPASWLSKFPTGAEILDKVVSLRPLAASRPDIRLLKRRDCEFELFRSIEEAFFFPKIQPGFENVDDFLALSQSMTQSRKARGGNSLEFQFKRILDEEGFIEDVDYSYNKHTENKRKPDFIFPSISAYNDSDFDEKRLSMLAVKSSVRERWAQVLKEADKTSSYGARGYLAGSIR